MKRRSAEDHCDDAADEEKHRRLQNLQSRRGSRLRHHFSSIMLPKHMSMSLALLRSILVIYIAARCNDITTSPMVDAASNGIRCTTRMAFCSHNTRQATPSSRMEIGNIRPHSTSPIELGQHYRANCKRNGNGCLPVLSFPSSSTSALGLTDKQSTPDETIDANRDTTVNDEESQTHEKNQMSNVLFEGSASPLIETDLAPISTNIIDSKPKTCDTATREQGRAFLARVSVLFAVLVLAVLQISPSGAWRYYLAGGICASTSHAITTPIDVVKVRCAVLLFAITREIWAIVVTRKPRLIINIHHCLALKNNTNSTDSTAGRSNVARQNHVEGHTRNC